MTKFISLCHVIVQAPLSTTLKLEGMTCGGCVKTIKGALEPLEGVVGFNVSLQGREARVVFKPGTLQASTVLVLVLVLVLV